MAPFYSETITKPRPNDDISRIQAFYGPSTGEPNPTPTPTPEPEPDVSAPSNLVAILNGRKKVELQWVDNSTGEDRFEVWRDGTVYGSVGRGRTSATDNGVQEGKTYGYKIRAILGDRISDFSNEVFITVPGSVPTPTPEPEPEPTKTTVITIKGTDFNVDVK
jgi:hypothetical protein